MSEREIRSHAISTDLVLGLIDGGEQPFLSLLLLLTYPRSLLRPELFPSEQPLYLGAGVALSLSPVVAEALTALLLRRPFYPSWVGQQ